MLLLRPVSPVFFPFLDDFGFDSTGRNEDRELEQKELARE